jgi:hypothetical protein
VPERIKAVTKEKIISVSNAMFTPNIWGFGVLGNCGEKFADQLQAQISPLWAGELIPSPKLRLTTADLKN